MMMMIPDSTGLQLVVVLISLWQWCS